MKVLGVDLSWSSTGIAIWNGQNITFYDYILTNSKEDPMARIHRVKKGIFNTIAKKQPDLIVLEGYAFGRPQGATKSGEMAGVIKYFLWKKQIPFELCPPTTLKKFATGKGNASKEQMIEAATPFIKGVRSNDIADACHLARWGYDVFRND